MKPPVASGKANVQAWMQMEPTVLWPIVTALTVVLVLMVRMFRSGGEGKKRMPGREETLNLIKGRRSVFPKDYTGDRLTHTELGLVLEAANWAPTHGKTEPWRYVVVSGHAALTKYLVFLDNWYTDRIHLLSEEAVAKFRRKLDGLITEWPEKVSHLLLIVMKRQALPEKRMPEWEELSAVAMSVQNMQLQVASLGNSGCFWSSHTWCKDARESVEMKMNFGFEEEDKIMGALILGRVDPSRHFKSVRGPMEKKLHFRVEH